MSILPQQNKRWLYPVPDPVNPHCKACEGERGHYHCYGDEDYWVDCQLCNGTGDDDSLLAEIRSGALVPPLEG